MRIGLLTYHRAYNCGAMLQAWALKTVLAKMGHDVRIPACNSVGEEPLLKSIPNNGYRGLRRACTILGYLWLNIHLVLTMAVSYRRHQVFRKRFLADEDVQPEDFANHYDLVVVGSDQVWSERHSKQDGALFFGESIPKEVPIITYATSYGDKFLLDEYVPRVVRAANRCRAIAIREDLIRDQLQDQVNVPMVRVLDPTLLLASQDYAEIASNDVPDGDYLYAYVLWATPFVMKVVGELAKRLHIKAIITPVYQKTRWWHCPPGLTFGISPDRMVGYIRNAKYVITSSFHGTAFAIIYKKPFLSLRELENGMEGRAKTLLEEVGEVNRLVNPDYNIDTMQAVLASPLDSVGIDVKLEKLRAASLAWLEKNVR